METETERVELSQAEFARRLNVSRAAVSQWKSNDILKENAFTKPGKKGKLIFDIAVEQVRKNRDIGQSLGNGIGTRTSGGEEAAPVAETPPVSEPALPIESIPAPAVGQPSQPEPTASAVDAPVPPQRETVEDQIKKARLEAQLRTNRMQAAEEALQQGRLIATDDARQQMTRLAGLMLQIFEGSLTDIAAAMASKFDLPQRDVLHLLRAEFRKVRETATKKEKATAQGIEKEVEASLD